MPPKGKIARKTRISYRVFSLGIEACPGATHERIFDWVKSNAETWRKIDGWEVPQFSRSRDIIRQILKAAQWMDSDWYLGAYTARQAHTSDIPEESIPDVLVVALRVFAGGKRLTVRQAWWVSRLVSLSGPLISKSDAEIEDVYSLAVAYSANDRAAAALSEDTGTPELVVADVFEPDTWSLDVLASLEHSVLLPEAGFYEVMQEAGFIGQPDWETNIRAGITTTTEEVEPLRDLLLTAIPDLDNSCKALTSALLWLRVYAERRVEWGQQSGNSAFEEFTKPVQFYEASRSAPEWDSLSYDEKLHKSREIGSRVMKEITAAKEKAAQAKTERQTDNAKEIALLVMELIEKQKRIENAN